MTNIQNVVARKTIALENRSIRSEIRLLKVERKKLWLSIQEKRQRIYKNILASRALR